MLCVFCDKNTTKEVFTDYEKNINGKKIIVRNVPALFCEACGDYYFDHKTLKLIKEKIKDLPRNSEYIAVFDYNNFIS
jgi:YgiT-type zinc finger domain-containing protein